MPNRRDLLAWIAAIGPSAGAVFDAAAAPPARRPVPAEPPPTMGESAHSFSAVVTKRVPMRYLSWLPDPQDRPADGWPLVIFLHGSGERGDDIEKVKAHGPPQYASAGRRFPFVLVAPQVADELAWDSDALEALRIELLAHLPINPDRVLMTGMSMGGIGTWNYAVDYPEALAGIAPVCGAGDGDRATRIRTLPAWAFHGALDTEVPLVGDQMMIDALKALGSAVRFTVYPDLGHDIWDRAYTEPALYTWLLAQRRPRRVPPVAKPAPAGSSRPPRSR